MNKSQAIMNANNAVDKPVGRTGHWEIFGPYRAKDLDGPWTSLVRPTYAEALTRQRLRSARMSCSLPWSDWPKKILKIVS